MSKKKNTDLEKGLDLMDEDDLKQVWTSHFKGQFARRVFFHLTLLMAFNVILIYLSAKWIKLQYEIATHSKIFWIAVLTFATLLVLLTCLRFLTRRFPINYLLFLAFGFSQAWILTRLAIKTNYLHVLIPVCIMFSLMLTLVIYSNIVRDGFSPLLATVFLILSAVGVVLLFDYYYVIGYKIYFSVIFTVFIGIYIIFDTGHIIKQRRFDLQHDDYIFVALVLYVDMILLVVGLVLSLLLWIKDKLKHED